MPQSEQIGELAQAIAKAQAELKPVKKEVSNPFFNKKYADLAAVWEALKPFTVHGIAITQMPFDAGEGMIGITTQLTHSSGQWIAGSLALPVSKQDAQGVGSAVTYARRYSLGCMTGVVTEDDDDGNQATQAKPAAKQYTHHKQEAARKIAELRADDTFNQFSQDMRKSKEPPFNPEVCPPADDAVTDEDFQAFCEYVGDDPDRTKVGKKMKAKFSIGDIGSMPRVGRKAFILSVQDEAKRQGVPFSEWVKE